MNNYRVISDEIVMNMATCFSGSEELRTFVLEIEKFMQEINFMSLLRLRIEDEHIMHTIMREVCLITLFFRNHIEVLQQLMMKLETRDATPEEIKQIKAKEEEKSD